MVDADPQCNSTIYCFRDELFTEIYYEKKGFTIYDVIKPVNQGIGYVKEVKKYYLEDFGFNFIAGDPQLALFEDTLASDWSASLSGGERGIRTTLTFNDLIGRFKEYDYVIFDMGPSLGAINRAILLACDYFITPMSSDIFSLLAIENIGKTIKGWRDESSKMIFTRSQYTNARYEHAAFYKLLEALSLNYTFVFLGCGFSDPDIQLVLENYSFVFPGSPSHYFITPEDGINDEYKRIIKENRNLEVITYDSKNNHQELHDALEVLVPLVEDERTRIAKEMDW